MQKALVLMRLTKAKRLRCKTLITINSGNIFVAKIKQFFFIFLLFGASVTLAEQVETGAPESEQAAAAPKENKQAPPAENKPSAATQQGEEDNMQIIHAFTSQEEEVSEIVAISDQRKREVMFYLGVPLLLFILITAGLGIAMGVYGKDVYLPHMIFAGFSVTLALAHAVVGIVWFYPF